MKRFIWLMALVGGLSIGIFSQEVKTDSIKEVKVLSMVEGQPKCLLLLNERFYLVSMSDIQLIDKEQVETIQMYMPDSEEFKLLVTLVKGETKDIMSAFKIKTRAGFELPDKFKE